MRKVIACLILAVAPFSTGCNGVQPPSFSEPAALSSSAGTDVKEEAHEPPYDIDELRENYLEYKAALAKANMKLWEVKKEASDILKELQTIHEAIADIRSGITPQVRTSTSYKSKKSWKQKDYAIIRPLVGFADGYDSIVNITAGWGNRHREERNSYEIGTTYSVYDSKAGDEVRGLSAWVGVYYTFPNARHTCDVYLGTRTGLFWGDSPALESISGAMAELVCGVRKLSGGWDVGIEVGQRFSRPDGVDMDAFFVGIHLGMIVGGW